MTTRRTALLGLVATLATALVGCAAERKLPALHWVRLPPDPAPPLPAPASPSPEVWQLLLPLPLPGHLERDALLVPQGATGVEPVAGVRWAEPLRDAVPRLLRQDLGVLLGTPIWGNSLPPGLRATRQLRVELLQLDATPGAAGVALHARWSVAEPGGTSAPRSGELRLTQPAANAEADALVLAHRAALAQLAQAIVR